MLLSLIAFGRCRLIRPVNFSCILLVLLMSSAKAELVETWIQDDEPSASTISAWKTYPSPKRLRLHLNHSPSKDLAKRLGEVGFDRIQITSVEYPLSSSVDRWKELAAQEIEFIYLGGALPTPTQLKLLNEIRFSRILFIFNRYFDYEERPSLHGLSPEIKYDLHFAVNKYPRYLQKFPIAELPKTVGVQVSVDYWPRYIQMDVMNLIPQPKKLRVAGTPLSAGAIEYTNHLENIHEITFDSDFEPPFNQWPALEKFPLRWLLRGMLPSEKYLDSLATWASENRVRFQLSVDPGFRPTPEQRKRYEELPFDVDWTADAP